MEIHYLTLAKTSGGLIFSEVTLPWGRCRLAGRLKRLSRGDTAGDVCKRFGSLFNTAWMEEGGGERRCCAAAAREESAEVIQTK